MNNIVMACVGGALIGVAALMLMAIKGRIMGISGIIGGLLPDTEPDYPWRISFIAGLLCAPLGYLLINNQSPTVEVASNPLLLVLAGLLVGAGTVVGNGCTSGHGVCGTSRFSIRSIVATVLFLGTAIITVLLVKLVTGSS